MTCIAYKDGILAADRMTVSYGNSKGEATKIFKFGPGRAIGGTGNLAQVKALLAWYQNGAKPEEFPKTDKDDEWARLIVAYANKLVWYESSPHHFLLESRRYAAFGSGADVALGAMFMGADAEQAVEAASSLLTDVGMGVDVIDLRGA